MQRKKKPMQSDVSPRRRRRPPGAAPQQKKPYGRNLLTPLTWASISTTTLTTMKRRMTGWVPLPRAEVVSHRRGAVVTTSTLTEVKAAAQEAITPNDRGGPRLRHDAVTTMLHVMETAAVTVIVTAIVSSASPQSGGEFIDFFENQDTIHERTTTKF